MMELKFCMGLLQSDGKEPKESTGYRRADLGTIPLSKIQELPMAHQIVFPDALESYTVTAMACFCQELSNDPLKIWQLPQSIRINPGEVPVIHHGRLLRGVDVQAVSVSLCRNDCSGSSLGSGFPV